MAHRSQQSCGNEQHAVIATKIFAYLQERMYRGDAETGTKTLQIRKALTLDKFTVNHVLDRHMKGITAVRVNHIPPRWMPLISIEDEDEEDEEEEWDEGEEEGERYRVFPDRLGMRDACKGVSFSFPRTSPVLGYTPRPQVFIDLDQKCDVFVAALDLFLNYGPTKDAFGLHGFASKAWKHAVRQNPRAKNCIHQSPVAERGNAIIRMMLFVHEFMLGKHCTHIYCVSNNKTIRAFVDTLNQQALEDRGGNPPPVATLCTSWRELVQYLE